MGFETQVKQPAKHEPVVLFEEDLLGAADEENVGSASAAMRPVLRMLAASLNGQNGQDSVPPPGCPVRVFESNGEPSVWVADPEPRRLGAVVDTQREEVLAECRRIGRGLVGTVVGQPDGANVVLVRTRGNE